MAAFVGTFIVLDRVGTPAAKVTKETYATFLSDVRADRVATR